MSTEFVYPPPAILVLTVVHSHPIFQIATICEFKKTVMFTIKPEKEKRLWGNFRRGFLLRELHLRVWH